jgi:outer membrane protein assembly factor BamB
MNRAPFVAVLLSVLFALEFATFLRAADWPMWRYDAARSGASPTRLDDNLRLQWVRELPMPRPAWPKSQANLQFDAVVRPIVVGQRMFVGSTVNDSLTAYDTRSGELAWRFHTGGPVRFAPATAEGRIYVASDDGYLYCLESDTGRLQWKVRGGPSDRRILGNERLISTWPVRGGPVVAEGTVYFTAGIWPFMGIFVHAVDARTGELLWTNSETGSRWITHPHGAPSFGSVVPQGYLAVSGPNLIVPGGRSLPAVFDRATGALRHFDFGGKGAGGWQVTANDDVYVVGEATLSVESGAPLAKLAADVLTDNLLVGSTKAYWLPGGIRQVDGTDRKGNVETRTELAPTKSWSLPLGPLRVMMMAGGDLFAGGPNQVARFDLSSLNALSARDKGQELANQEDVVAGPTWTAKVEGQVAEALAADKRLFVVTHEGAIYCFGTESREPVRWPLPDETASVVTSVVPSPGTTLAPTPSSPTLPDQRLSKLAATVFAQPDATEGYAVALGVGTSSLIDELVADSGLHVIVLDVDNARVEAFRQSWDRAGKYGIRVAADVGTLETKPLPPYLANVIVAESLEAVEDELATVVEQIYGSLRPYGGFACLGLSDGQHAVLRRMVDENRLPRAELSREAGTTLLRRSGPLLGAGSWTHQYADAANSVVSQDALVKSPLGVLWFGGPSNDRVLPRHGHGPSPQVAGGRLVIEGADMLRCVDVYTGRLLWERDLPGLGRYYDTTAHFAGAGEVGSNYVTMPDAIYVVYGSLLLELEATTGQTRRLFSLRDGGRVVAATDDAVLAAGKATSAAPSWGFLCADGDRLLATTGPVRVADETTSENEPQRASLTDALSPSRYAPASRRLVVFDRRTGQRLWSRDAALSFRHNSVVLAGDRVYCIDAMSDAQLQVLRRRGIEPSGQPRLLALDAATGKEVWSTGENVFGTFLNYSAQYDVLLQAGSAYRDRARDEAKAGMAAYRGRDGALLWQDLKKPHGGPCLLWGDKIITNGGGGYQLELLTGKDTGWTYERMYGCNTAIGSRHLLTFRSGAAGFCDLTGDSGTGNLGGFRSSCTSNLVIADGVLNAPDYTRTCTCAYQNQCSLALVHVPDVESWTFSSRKELPDRYGVNLGAPGDRRSADGLLWYEFPSVGGRSPEVPLTIRPATPTIMRHHASRVAADKAAPAWITSSGIAGIQELRYSAPDGDPDRRCTVRLYFAELEGQAPGQRVFDVTIQGAPAIQKLDIAAEAGGHFRPLVKEFRDIPCGSTVVIQFTPHQGQACLSGIEVVPQ